MGFFSKLAFWKKDDLDLGSDLGPRDNMDMGYSQQDMSLSQGMPDMTAYRGVGDRQQQQAMNKSIQQQFGPNYMEDSAAGFSSFSPKQSYREAPNQPGFQNHEMEVVSAKLDAIRATLDSINQRLANLERVAYGEQTDRRKYNW